MAVPDSNTFSFLDVCNELYRGYDDGMNLSQSFTDSDATKFDSNYGSKTMNPKSLYGFRNYGVQGGGDDNIISTPSFIVFRFLWSSSDGKDLDSMTEFVASGIANLNKKPIGSGAPSPSNNAGGLNILRRSGDNTSSGAESVMIDLSVLRNSTNLPNLIETSLINLYANWYQTRANGNCTIEVKAYRGGTISLSGTEWINSGGTSILEPALTLTKNIKSEGTLNYIFFRKWYTYIGQIKYSKSTGNITLSI